jgi:serine/threonine protein kinase
LWQEAVKLAQCKHPHIVRVKDSFKEGQQVCLVMEYIQGQDLTHANRLTEKEALHYIRQIGSALMVVHENNLVHRDVRPGNIIMRQGKREAVLIDFGLAVGFDHPLTTINPTTADGFTPLELYHVDAERGAYTDVYSLAATLYQLLTGEKPPSVRDRSLGRAKLKPPQDVNPQMSDRTNQAILRGMALAPEERPQTMQEWLDLLGVVPQIPQPWRNWDLTIWLTIIGTIAGVLSMIAGFLALKPQSAPPPETTPEITPTSQQVQPETRSLDLTPP